MKDYILSCLFYYKAYLGYIVYKRWRFLDNVVDRADSRPLVVHYITHDKFTEGYIFFMKKCFAQYYHVFFTTNGKYESTLSIIPDVYVVPYWTSTFFNPTTKKILHKAAKVIYSGLFDRYLLCVMPEFVLRKGYFHFWGGDFYSFREKPTKLSELIKRRLFVRALLKSGGVVNLIEEEWTQIKTILNLPESLPHYTAPMWSDPDQKVERFRKVDEVLRIVVGNSATVGNRHLAVFELLKHIRNDNVEIWCPLSYGDMEYAEIVKREGESLFGEKFHALTSFIPLREYSQFLANCDVGIFNNNRQQALGNIYYLFYLGKKVYLDLSTSMAARFKNLKLNIFDVKELQHQSLEEIMYFDSKDAMGNQKICEDEIYNLQKAVNQWNDVFEA